MSRVRTSFRAPATSKSFFLTYTRGTKMTMSKFTKRLLICVFALGVALSQPVQAYSQTTTRNLVLQGATESIDSSGRIVLVARVQGDLSGVLTLALVVGSDGTVTGGEWALNLSYMQYGPGVTRDGDPGEALVKLGVLKGSVTGGNAHLAGNGLATDLNGIQLKLTGATNKFAATTSGSGTLVASLLNQPNASNGSITLTF